MNKKNIKKYKWFITIALILDILFVLIFLGSLRVKNIDMTDMRLLITYWKEYLIGAIITIICSLGIEVILKD